MKAALLAANSFWRVGLFVCEFEAALLAANSFGGGGGLFVFEFGVLAMRLNKQPPLFRAHLET
jgi:hypothetical protein